jgi:hypothetical protein
MGFLSGLTGAILGAVVGGITAIFSVAVATGGDSFAIVLFFTIVAPIGMVVGGSLGIVAALRLLRFARKNEKNKTSKRKTVLVVVGTVLAVPALGAAMLWEIWHLGQPPSDQQLLINFARHKATFNKLSQMALIDKNLTRVDYDWTDPSDTQKIGVSPERIAEYRSLLESVGLHRGFSSDGIHSVEFISYAQGSAMSSDEDKGYAYLITPPKETQPNLDDCQPDEKNGTLAYRHVEGCWHLY